MLPLQPPHLCVCRSAHLFRFHVCVCTAAERAYALEAWRLLDPGAVLIPPTATRQRIKSDIIPKKGDERRKDRKKTLLESLSMRGGCPPLDNADGTKHWQSAFPMAIILDDRLEVLVVVSRHTSKLFMFFSGFCIAVTTGTNGCVIAFVCHCADSRHTSISQQPASTSS